MSETNRNTPTSASMRGGACSSRAEGGGGRDGRDLSGVPGLTHGDMWEAVNAANRDEAEKAPMVRIVCVFSGVCHPAHHGLILLVILMVVLVVFPLVVAVGAIVMGVAVLWAAARHKQWGILVVSQMGFHTVYQAGVSNATRKLRLPRQLSARSWVTPTPTAAGGMIVGMMALMRTYVGAPGVGLIAVVAGRVVRLSTPNHRRNTLRSASLMLGCRCLTCQWCWSVDTLPPRPTGTRKLLGLVTLVPPRVWV